VLSDATKSVSRAYINNFQDKAKQIAIDTFLVGSGQDEIVQKLNDVQGNLSNQLQVTIYDPVHDFVRATLEKRYDFSTFIRNHLTKSPVLLSIQAKDNAIYL
jgi:hypothetical protein